MHDWIRTYSRWVIKARYVVLGLAVLATAMLAWQATTVHVDNRVRVWVPQHQPFVLTTRAIQRKFGVRNAVVVGIVADSGTIFQRPILEEIRRVQKGLARMPQAVRKDVMSIAATKVRSIRGTAAGMVVHRMMPRIPKDAQGMARLRARVAQNPAYAGLLVSRNDRAAAVIGAFRLSASHPSYLPLYDKIRSIVGPRQGPGYRTYIGGAPSWSASLEQHMHTMPLFFGLAFLVIMIIQFIAFRTLQGAILPMITALLSTVWALGFMGLFSIPMDVLNSVTPILIMAIGTGHSTQMLKRYYEEYERLARKNDGRTTQELRYAAITEFMVQTGPVMMLAGIIAVLAFLSLTLAPIIMIRHFGLLTAMGIGSVLILEMSFMPALRAILPSPKRSLATDTGPTRLDRLFDSVADAIVDGKSALIVFGTISCVAALAIGMVRLRADNTPKDYFGRSSVVRHENRVLNHTFAGTGSIFFRIQGQRRGAIKDPQVLSAMARLQAFLKRQPGIGKTQSLANFVAQMNQAMHQGNPAYYRIPRNRDLVAQYLFLYSASGSPSDFDNLVDHRYQNAVIWVFAKHDGTTFTEHLYKKAQAAIAREFPPGVRVTMGGGLAETVAINHSVIHEKMENMVQMALVVFLLASLALRSFVGGAYVVTPLILIVLANFGVMGWSGLPLDMGTVTTASLAMGIGADYELYLLFRFREEWVRLGDLREALRISLRTSGRAVLFVTSAIIGGYSVLFFAGFGFYTQLATMVVATMVVSLVLAVVFLRALVVMFKPRFIFSGTMPAVSLGPITRHEES
ncbi:MAG: efflux RND transporter permease subunit [Acidiferrobacter sp.]